MSFEGMDPGEVQKIAQKLKAQREQVVRVATTVDNTVRGARSAWKGADVEEFNAQWSTHRAGLSAAGDALGELATKAFENALEQIRTSDEYSGGAGVGGGPGGTGSGGGQGGPGGTGGGNGNGFPPLLQKAWDLWNKDLWKTGHEWSGHVGPYGELNGSTTIGGIPVSGGVSGGAGAHGSAGYHGSFSLRHGLDAGVDASGQAGLYGEAHGSIGNQYVNANGQVTALLGVQGNAGANAHLGLDGLSGHAELGGFAGGQVGASGDVDVLGAHASGGAAAQYGVGIGGSADGSLSLHDIGGDFDFHIALGGGFDIHGGLHVDPGEVLDDGYSALKSGWGDVTSFAGDAGNTVKDGLHEAVTLGGLL